MILNISQKHVNIDSSCCKVGKIAFLYEKSHENGIIIRQCGTMNGIRNKDKILLTDLDQNMFLYKPESSINLYKNAPKKTIITITQDKIE